MEISYFRASGSFRLLCIYITLEITMLVSWWDYSDPNKPKYTFVLCLCNLRSETLCVRQTGSDSMKRKGERSRRGVFTDRQRDGKCAYHSRSPRRHCSLAVSLTTFTPKTSLTFHHTSVFSNLSFSFLLLSHHTDLTMHWTFYFPILSSDT